MRSRIGLSCRQPAMNYRFSNLLGAPYRGGNLLIHENELLTPVGNRVTQASSSRRQSRPAAERAHRRLACHTLSWGRAPAGPGREGGGRSWVLAISSQG